MLQVIRDRLTGWVAGLVIAVIGVALVISFGKMKTDVGAENFAARVNGDDISLADYRQFSQNQLLREQQQTRSELTPDAQLRLRREALEQLVRSRVVAQFVQQQGYRVDNPAVADSIAKIQAFQVDGKFSRAAYEAALAGQGVSVTQFEKEQRTSITVQQLENTLLDSSFITPAEFRDFIRLEGERRQASYALIDRQKLQGSIQVSEADLQAYYDAHADKFEAPESAAVDYIEARMAVSGGDLTMDEAKLRAIYDADPARFKAPEQRHARHILLAQNKDRTLGQAEALAKEIATRLSKGEAFDSLARQYSSDTGSANAGGDLGWAGRGTFVGPFETALFSLNVGEISPPVKTEFGYHIIQLQEVRGGTLKPFEEVREEIAKDAGSRDAQERYTALTEKMDDAALQNPNSLEPVAKATGLPIQHVDMFSRSGGGPFGANRAVINAVFSAAVLDEGENSALVEAAEGRTVVLRVSEHRKAHIRPFAEVKTDAEAAYRQDKATQLAESHGKEMLTRLNAGAEFAAAARDLDATITTPQLLGRGSTDVPPELLIAIYRAPRPVGVPVFGGVALPTGGYAVYRLEAVQPGRPEDVPREQRDARKANLARQAGVSDTAALAADLRRKASLVVAPTLFEQEQ
jgi:peptidyl-prolyl cis-trans isomerase D